MTALSQKTLLARTMGLGPGKADEDAFLACVECGGFFPLNLAYPFPAVRNAGLLADSWLTQSTVPIGSAIEIPLWLFILHRRAKDFNENRARISEFALVIVDLFNHGEMLAYEGRQMGDHTLVVADTR